MEGAREVGRALEAGVRFSAVLVGDDASASQLELAAAVAASGTPSYRVGDAAFAKVSVRRSPAQILGIAHSPSFSLEDRVLPRNPLVLIADRIEKPGNLGAMIRTADGAGADAVIACDPATDLVNPNIIRASQGSVFASPAAAATTEAVKAWLVNQEIRTVAASSASSANLWETDLTGPLAIVIGSEHAGISEPWRDSPVISIPMQGLNDSLNASVAAALLLYEARRQRRLVQP